MLNMDNMYREFYSKNLEEYNKIIKILDSCETWDQFLCMENVAYSFARNCEWRRNVLFDRYERGISIKRYKEYRKYEQASELQCKDLMDRVAGWADSYKNTLEEAKVIIEKQDEESKKRKVIPGFKFPKRKSKRS